ncbi:hypothetical protein BpHYR1_032563 [Brachionus plicatilis]|uniref:Uncharacterized protein n=1 Tax=Brachionus plicatilis TaxID=10195 RepID=A0A3M7RRG2_BRAPC|nr:hypothetical protein BpHYR1_032563 [Brachionus plicatilis]
MFNSCFASITSSSLSKENDSAKFTFETFRELKLNNSLVSPGFSFIEFSLDQIKKALDDLSSSSSPGSIRIHSIILKGLPDTFVPLLHQLFNECIKCFPIGSLSVDKNMIRLHSNTLKELLC